MSDLKTIAQLPCALVPFDSLHVEAEAGEAQHEVISMTIKSFSVRHADILLTYEDAAQLVKALTEQLQLNPAPAPEAKPAPQRPSTPVSYSCLSPQAQTILQHMRRAGSISAREAMADHGITSAALARRICDLEAGGYIVNRKRKTHPLTGKGYTRYSVVEL